MKPLSAIQYVKKSFSKIIPITITVSLAVAALYFMAMFVSQLDRAVNEASIYPYENSSLILGGDKGISSDDLKEINLHIKKLRKFIVCSGGVDHKSIVGNTGTDILFSDEKSIKEIFKIKKFKVIEGNLPAKPGDIIIHEKLAKAYSLKPGDKVKKGRDSWYLGRDSKITGIYRAKAVIGLGVEEDKYLIEGNPYNSLYLCGPRTLLNEVDSYLEKDFANKYRVYTEKIQIDKINSFNGPVTAMKIFLGVILIIAIGVFLANITSVQFINRKKELQLLHAIGYTRKQIIFRAFQEIFYASLFGYIFGIIIAILLGLGLNFLIFNDLGTEMPLILPDSVLTVLSVPIAIIVFGMIAPLKHTRFMDLG